MYGTGKTDTGNVTEVRVGPAGRPYSVTGMFANRSGHGRDERDVPTGKNGPGRTRFETSVTVDNGYAAALVGRFLRARALQNVSFLGRQIVSR